MNGYGKIFHVLSVLFFVIYRTCDHDTPRIVTRPEKYSRWENKSISGTYYQTKHIRNMDKEFSQVTRNLDHEKSLKMYKIRDGYEQMYVLIPRSLDQE